MQQIFTLSERAGFFWNHHYSRLSWRTLYRVHLRVVRTLASASSMFLTPRLLRRLTGSFASFFFSFLCRDRMLFISVARSFASAAYQSWLLWHRHDVTQNLNQVLTVHFTDGAMCLHNVHSLGCPCRLSIAPGMRLQHREKIYIAGPNSPRTYFPYLFPYESFHGTRHLDRIYWERNKEFPLYVLLARPRTCRAITLRKWRILQFSLCLHKHSAPWVCRWHVNNYYP